MASKPLRRAAAGWAKQLQRMYGIPLRLRVFDQLAPFYQFVRPLFPQDAGRRLGAEGFRKPKVKQVNYDPWLKFVGKPKVAIWVKRGRPKEIYIGTLPKNERSKWRHLEFIDDTHRIEFIAAHELGHALATAAAFKTHGPSAPRVLERRRELTNLIALISQLEFAKRYAPRAYRTNINFYKSRRDPNLLLHYGEMGFAIRIMESFPNPKQRNEVVKSLLLSNVTTLKEAKSFLKTRGLK